MTFCDTSDKAIKTGEVIALLVESWEQIYVSQWLRWVVQLFKELGNGIKRPVQSKRLKKKRYTEPRDERFLVSQALRNLNLSSEDLQKSLEEVRVWRGPTPASDTKPTGMLCGKVF